MIVLNAPTISAVALIDNLELLYTEQIKNDIFENRLMQVAEMYAKINTKNNKGFERSYIDIVNGLRQKKATVTIEKTVETLNKHFIF